MTKDKAAVVTTTTADGDNTMVHAWAATSTGARVELRVSCINSAFELCLNDAVVVSGLPVAAFVVDDHSVTSIPNLVPIALAASSFRANLTALAPDNSAAAFSKNETHCVASPAPLALLSDHLFAAIALKASESEAVARLEFAVSIDGLTCQLRLIPARAIAVGFELNLNGQQTQWFGLGELLNQQWPLNKSMLPPTHFVTWDNAKSGLSPALAPLFWNSLGAGLHFPDALAEDLVVSLNAEPHALKEPVFRTDEYACIFSTVWDKAQYVATQKPHSECPPAQSVARFGDDKLRLRTSGSGNSNPLVLEMLLPESGMLGDLPSAFRTLARRELARGTLAETGSSLDERGALSSWRAPRGDAMMRRAIWSTWAELKSEIDERRVLELASRVGEMGMVGESGAIFEIDDKWQPNYGDLRFDERKFPDAAQTVAQLHEMGFLVMLWVPPFMNPDSDNFCEAKHRGFLLNGGELVTWWQGRGALLDVFNGDAVCWWKTQLRSLMAQTGVDGIKFDAGEANFVPETTLPAGVSRNAYTQRYCAMAAEFELAEARCAYGFGFGRQPRLFVREYDKSSKWGKDNGLQSVVTGALTLGMLGHAFVLPDMIGGNKYENADEVSDPVEYAELYVRWMQASIAMPSVQFSVLPDSVREAAERARGSPLEYDLVGLCAKYLRARERALLPIITRAAAESAETGEPIVRAVFWTAPTALSAAASMSAGGLDSVGVVEPYAARWALADLALEGDGSVRADPMMIDDEFLIGDRLLVAPVMTHAARSRRVYLPVGRWVAWDLLRHPDRPPTEASPTSLVLSGPCELEVDAAITSLPLFYRL